MKEKLDELRNILENASKELGITLKIGSMTYGNSTVTFSCRGYISGGKQEEFNRYAIKKGIPKEWYNKKLCNPKTNEVFVVSGVLPRGRTYTVEITNVTTGEGRRATTQYVAANLID